MTALVRLADDSQIPIERVLRQILKMNLVADSVMEKGNNIYFLNRDQRIDYRDLFQIDPGTGRERIDSLLKQFELAPEDIIRPDLDIAEALATYKYKDGSRLMLALEPIQERAKKITGEMGNLIRRNYGNSLSFEQNLRLDRIHDGVCVVNKLKDIKEDQDSPSDSRDGARVINLGIVTLSIMPIVDLYGIVNR